MKRMRSTVILAIATIIFATLAAVAAPPCQDDNGSKASATACKSCCSGGECCVINEPHAPPPITNSDGFCGAELLAALVPEPGELLLGFPRREWKYIAFHQPAEGYVADLLKVHCIRLI